MPRPVGRRKAGRGVGSQSSIPTTRSVIASRPVVVLDTIRLLPTGAASEYRSRRRNPYPFGITESSGKRALRRLPHQLKHPQRAGTLRRRSLCRSDRGQREPFRPLGWTAIVKTTGPQAFLCWSRETKADWRSCGSDFYSGVPIDRKCSSPLLGTPSLLGSLPAARSPPPPPPPGALFFPSSR